MEIEGDEIKAKGKLVSLMGLEKIEEELRKKKYPVRELSSFGSDKKGNLSFVLKIEMGDLVKP